MEILKNLLINSGPVHSILSSWFFIVGVCECRSNREFTLLSVKGEIPLSGWQCNPEKQHRVLSCHLSDPEQRAIYYAVTMSLTPLHNPPAWYSCGDIISIEYFFFFFGRIYGGTSVLFNWVRYSKVIANILPSFPFTESTLSILCFLLENKQGCHWLIDFVNSWIEWCQNSSVWHPPRVSNTSWKGRERSSWLEKKKC